MSRKRYKPEQIINLLREAEIRLSQGQTVGEVCRALGELGAELLLLALGVRGYEV